MRSTAWWMVAVVGLAGCGGALEEGTPESDEDSLGTLRQQAENTCGGAVSWVRFVRSERVELGSAVTQDRDGNVLTTVLFSGGTGTGHLGTWDAEVPGLVLAKHSPGGELLWTRVFLGRAGGQVAVNAVGTDRERNVFFAGWSEAGAELRSSELAPPVTLEGAFLGKLDRDGTLLWVKTLEGDAAFLANGLVTDRAGNVFVSGSLHGGSLDFCGRTLTAEGQRAFLVKFGPDGTLRWLHAEREGTQAGGVALDEVGDAYVCASGPDDRPGAPSGGTWTGLRRLEANRGALVWTRSLEDGECSGVAVHGNRVVMTGSFAGAFTFGGRTYRASDTPGEVDSDAFVVAYTRAGETRWAHHFAWRGTGVAMDQEDGVLVIGHHETGDPVGGTTLPGVPGSVDNIFAVKLDRIDGALRWVRGFPSEAALALDVFTTREGEGALVGAIGGPTDFGRGAVSPVGSYDAFILRLGK